MKKKSAKTFFEIIGIRGMLSGQKLQDFANFMVERFPGERDESYIEEWAERFRYNREWQSADSESQEALIKVNPNKYKRLQEKN